MRFYSLEIIIYSSDIQNVISSLLEYSNIVHYCCILHDKDIDLDGNLKKSHIHFIATFKYAISYTLCAKMFNFYLHSLDLTVLPENISKIKTTLKSCYFYLIHKFDPDKFQYNIDDIYSDSPLRFSSDNSYTDNVSYLIVQDLLDGRSLKSMAMAYGRDFILNYSKYCDFVFALKDEIRNWLRPISSSTDEQLCVDFSSDDSSCK